MKIARAPKQMILLDVLPSYPMENNAKARNAYGSCAQEIVCAAIKADPIPINGNCEICFDAEARGVFYEIKSARAGSKVCLYDWRIRKEANSEKPLKYAILLHNVGAVLESRELWRRMALTSKLVILSASTIHRLAMEEPLKNINPLAADRGPRFGYSRRGYAEGYRSVPIKKIMDRCRASRTEDFWLHDFLFSVPIISE